MVPVVVFAKRITCIQRSWRVGVFVFSWPFSAKSGREKWKERKCRYICPFATQDNQRISDARLFIREQELNQSLLVKEFKKEWLPFPANKTIQEQSLRSCMKNTSIQFKTNSRVCWWLVRSFKTLVEEHHQQHLNKRSLRDTFDGSLIDSFWGWNFEGAWGWKWATRRCSFNIFESHKEVVKWAVQD